MTLLQWTPHSKPHTCRRLLPLCNNLTCVSSQVIVTEGTKEGRNEPSLSSRGNSTSLIALLVNSDSTSAVLSSHPPVISLWRTVYILPLPSTCSLFLANNPTHTIFYLSSEHTSTMTPTTFSIAKMSVSFLLMFCLSTISRAAVVHEPLLGEQESSLRDKDFIFDLGGSTPTIDASGGRQFVMSRENTPGLKLSNGRNGGGGTQVLFRFEPCGFRTPHFHPRGTENFFVISGQVRANFLREEGGSRGQRVVVNDVSAGFAGFFPEAHVHFLQNFGCEEAMTLSVFDNSNEGLVDIAPTLQFPKDTIQLALGNGKLRPSDALFEDVLIQSQKCLRRCGLLKH